MNMLEKHLIANIAPAALPENMISANDWRITVLTDRLVRIEKSGNHQFCDEATQSVWYRDLPPVSFRTEHTPEGLSVITDKITLVLKESLKDSYVVLSEGGEKAFLNNEGNLHGTYRTLDCCDGDLWHSFDRDHPESHPITLDNGVASTTGAAVLDDGSSLILKADGTLSPRSVKETDIYVFAYGKDFRGALKALYRICGKTPLIPRFALGNWWSRYYAYT